MNTYTGRCLCGGIRFEIAGALPPVQICHCSQCRRAQGTAMATNVPVAVSQLRFVQGEALLKTYESSPGKFRVFCSECGSPVLSRRASLPDVVRLRLGLLDEPLDVQLGVHFYTGSKASWWPIHDDLPQCEGALEQAPPR